MARWFVTGAAGGLGSAVCRNLLSVGEQVRALDLRPPHPAEGLEVEVSDKYQLLIGDVRDRQLIRETVEDVDAILHLSALTIQAAETDPLAAFDINSRAFVELMDAASTSASRPVIVFASTATLLNPNPDVVLLNAIRKPDAVLNTCGSGTPLNFYAATKLFNEQSAWHWRSKGVVVVAVRLGLVTFAWGGQGLSQEIVNQLVRRPLAGESGRVPCGDDYPNWLAPVDAAAACVNAARLAMRGEARETYNVLGENRSMQEAIELSRAIHPGVHISGEPGIGGLDQRAIVSDLPALGVTNACTLEDHLAYLSGQIGFEVTKLARVRTRVKSM